MICNVLNLLGLVGAVVGIAMAVFGVRDLKRELFPGRPLPPSRAWQWLLRHVLFWRRREGRAASGAGVLSATGAIARAVGHVVSPRPETYAPSEEWMRHLVNRLDNIEESQGRERQRTADELKRIDDRISTATDSIQKEVRENHERFRRALGGKDGRGLDMTFWGFFITGAGVVLQVAALVLEKMCHACA